MLLNELGCFVTMPKLLSIMMFTEQCKMCSYRSKPVALFPVVQPLSVMIKIDPQLGCTLVKVWILPLCLLLYSNSAMPPMGANGRWLGLHKGEDAGFNGHDPCVQELLMTAVIKRLL